MSATLSSPPAGTAMPPAPANHRAGLSPIHWQPWIVAVLLVLFCIYTGWRTGDFWTVINWQLLVQPLAEAGLVSLGMTLVIATGGIDLSVGSIIGLSAVIAAVAAQHGASGLTVDLVAAGAGLAAGAGNGLLIGWLGLSPILVTLGTMILYAGLAVGISSGSSFAGFPAGALWWGDATWLGIPAPFLLFLVAVIAVAILLQRSLWGRYLLSFGSNPVAARFSGMPVQRALFAVYSAQGAFCGLAAMLMIGRLASARGDMGQSLMLTSIAAVVLGGTPIIGGMASVAGTVAGVAAFYVVQNGLTLVGVPAFLESALVAVLLLVAVAAGNLTKREP